MRNDLAKLAIGVLIISLLVSGMSVPSSATEQTESPVYAKQEEQRTPGVYGKAKLAEQYSVSEYFIQSELDKGLTLNEVGEALALSEGDTAQNYLHSLTRVNKQSVNLSANAESVISSSIDETIMPRMSAMNAPAEPKVVTKPNEAPFSVDLNKATVSTLSGTLSMQETDLVLPGRNGLAFALTRLYNSGSTQFYPLDYTTNQTADEKRFPIGKGWTWNISYIETAGAKKYLHLAGSGTYEIEGTTLKGYPWQDISLSEDTSVTVDGVASAYKLTSIHGLSQYFAADGRMIQTVDGYSNTITYRYSTQGAYENVLTEIEDAIGNTIEIAYTAAQVVLTMGDKTVTYIKSVNSGKELLTQVWDPLNRATTYDYEVKSAQYNLRGTTPNQDNPYALLTGVTYPTGGKSLYSYDATPIIRYLDTDMVNEAYRIIERRERVFYENHPPEDYNVTSISYSGDMASAPNADLTFSVSIDNDRTVTQFFNKKDYIDANTTAPFYNTKIEAASGTKKMINEYTYDEARRFDAPVQTAFKVEDSSNGGSQSPTAVTISSFDDYGNVTSVVNPLNVMSTYTYDPVTHLLQTAQEPISSTMSRYTEYERNVQGDVTKVFVRENGPSGPLLQQVEYLNFDSYGNISQVKVRDTDRDIVTDYEYDALHHHAYLTRKSVQVKDAWNNTSTVSNQYEYNTAAGTVSKAIDGNQHETLYTYDKLNRPTVVQQPDNSQVKLHYDDYNNRLTLIDEEGLIAASKWNPLGWQTESGYMEAGNYKSTAKLGYDSYGRLQWTEDAIGNRTQYVYDNWDRSIQIQYPDLTTHQTSYDDILNKTMVKDAAGNESIQTADLLGRVVRVEEQKAGGTPSIVAEYTYDHAGNMLTAQNALQQVTGYSYDALGQLTSVLNAKQELTQYVYSLTGNQTRTIYPDQTTLERQYDELGRQIRRTDGNGKIDRYQYDGNNNMIMRIDRNGDSFTFAYNERNFLTEKVSGDETISYAYDLSGKRTSMQDATGTTNYHYDPYHGSLTKVIFPDNRSIAYSYDENHRRSQMQDPFGAHLYYDYDEMNRLTDVRTALTEIPEASYAYTANGLLSSVTQRNEVQSTFTYDGLQLNALVHRKPNQSVIQSYAYEYDSVGNIETRTENGATNSFTYDSLNRIETSTQFAEAYTYDSKGNRATFVRNTLFENDNSDLDFDDRDRLVQVTTEGGKTVSYTYNGDNLLYERTENGETTRYYYDGQQVIAEGVVVNGEAELKARYIRGNGLISTEDAEGTKAYYLHNGHGDVVELMDDTGITSLNRYSYDIWGNPVSQDETIHNPFRYSGELWDDTTSLQYLRARWYDPSDGRFVGEDTYEGSLTNPLSLNLYTYVENNPLRWIDPSGHAKASDNEHLSGLVQGYTDRWNQAQQSINSIMHTVNTCFTVTLCQNAQTMLPLVDKYKALQKQYEIGADAVRIAYYNLHGLAIPSDVKYRDTSVAAPNITTQLNSLMSEFYADYKDYSASAAVKLRTFVNNVKTGGRVDVKNSHFKDNSYYVYTGELYRRDDLGNIYFGYAGKIFGYDDTFLKRGAGIYQIYSGTSEWGYVSSYFDDPRDSAMIQVGINIYNSTHK